MTDGDDLADAQQHRNELHLVGTLQVDPTLRQSADGAEFVSFRLAVRRPEGLESGTDSLECTVRSPRLRRAALGWSVGDLVEVYGAVCRRFYVTGGRMRPFVVVEVERARRRDRRVSRPRKTG